MRYLEPKMIYIMRNIFLTIMCLIPVLLESQIVLEQVYSIGGPDKDIVAVDLGHNDFKYVVMDWVNDAMDFYNVDHSPFAIGVSAPVSFVGTGYQPGYFSRSLFDCDSSTIEYAIWNPIDRSSFYVYRLDGTLLFQKDSVLAPYCYGCYGASNEKKPIYNTTNGAKLWFIDNSGDYLVYDLCGVLPAGMETIENSRAGLRAFPNPATNEISIACGEEFGNGLYEITVLDAHMKQVFTDAIPEDGNLITPLHDFQSGHYYFVIKSEYGVVRTGKFNVVK